MNFGFLGLLLTTPLQGVIVIACILFGMVLHNVVQALVADHFGDSSAKNYGFHGTDPRIHFDPMTLLFLVLLGFGIPRSIPMRGSSLRGRGNTEALVWLSGPLGMVVWAFVLLVLGSLLSKFVGVSLGNMVSGLFTAAAMLVNYAVVYIIPVPPLDGARALAATGSTEARRFLAQLESFGPIGFLLIFLVLSQLGVLDRITGPIISALLALLHLIGLG